MIQTQSSIRSQFDIRAWQLVAAALIVLMMPVNYRGGSELPHPHAFFQFWPSGDADAFDHHSNHRIDQVSPSAEHSHTPASHATSSLAPRPDTPILTDLGWPSERADGLAVVLFVTLLGVVVSVRALQGQPDWLIPSGLHPRPATPPPR